MSRGNIMTGLTFSRKRGNIMTGLTVSRNKPSHSIRGFGELPTVQQMVVFVMLEIFVATIVAAPNTVLLFC